MVVPVAVHLEQAGGVGRVQGVHGGGQVGGARVVAVHGKARRRHTRADRANVKLPGERGDDDGALAASAARHGGEVVAEAAVDVVLPAERRRRGRGEARDVAAAEQRVEQVRVGPKVGQEAVAQQRQLGDGHEQPARRARVRVRRDDGAVVAGDGQVQLGVWVERAAPQPAHGLGRGEEGLEARLERRVDDEHRPDERARGRARDLGLPERVGGEVLPQALHHADVVHAEEPGPGQRQAQRAGHREGARARGREGARERKGEGAPREGESGRTQG